MNARLHHLDLVVDDADTDELGHVNNAHYLRYVEAAARAHSRRLGLGLQEYRRLGSVPVVRAHHIRYLAPARPGDRLRVSTEVVALDRVRARRHTEVRRAADGALLAEADTEWVWIDPDRGRPVRVPPEVRRAFGGER